MPTTCEGCGRPHTRRLCGTCYLQEHEQRKREAEQEALAEAIREAVRDAGLSDAVARALRNFPSYDDTDAQVEAIVAAVEAAGLIEHDEFSCALLGDPNDHLIPERIATAQRIVAAVRAAGLPDAVAIELTGEHYDDFE